MAILRKVAWFVIASCRSLVQIHPPLTFPDYFAQCICPKGARDFWPENAENRPRSGLIDHSEPVFSGFTVFWAISALKARKLPDLSGRQIRQLLCDNSPKRCAEVGYLPKNAPVGRLPVAHLRLFFRSHRTMYTPNRDRSFFPLLRRSDSAGQFISSDCAAALLSYRI